MQVFLVQHGVAKLESDDPERQLTDAGRDEVRRVARHAAVSGPRPLEIRHSGKLRARQTAEILSEHLAPPRGLREMEGLGPTDETGPVRLMLEAAREPLMLVGHLPHLSRLASSLVVGDPNREIVRFRNAAIVCLGRGEGRWRIDWILTPDLART